VDVYNIRQLINEANNAYDFSRWMEAFNIYKKVEQLTDNGHVFYRLGMMYLVGYHIKKDTTISKPYFDKAFGLLQAAADAGDPEAQADLGYMYYNGHTPKGPNIDLALKYYMLAGDQGYSRALCNLGFIYYNGPGNGRPSDKKMAVEYYKQAAQNGSLVAHSNLGFIYKDKNEDVKQDYGLAVKHFFVAAKGNEKARDHLTSVFSGDCGDEYKHLATKHLASEWPKEHGMVNTNCKNAILEIFHLTPINSQDNILLPELATEITKHLITIWPEYHLPKKVTIPEIVKGL